MSNASILGCQITKNNRDTLLIKSLIPFFNCGRLEPAGESSVNFVVTKLSDIAGNIIPFGLRLFFFYFWEVTKTFLATAKKKKYFYFSEVIIAICGWQLAIGNWQLAIGNWQLAIFDWKIQICFFFYSFGKKKKWQIPS